MEKINNTTKFLLKRNKQQSDEFVKPENKLAREFFREQYKVEIAVFKCMDGRINFSSIIESLPQGIVQPYRHIAGVFNLGDPYLGSLIEGWVNYSKYKARKCLVLSTYHFSSGDHKRGCAGHKENTGAALEWSKKLVRQFNMVFGENTRNSVVYPIVVGIDTDTDALIFHNNGKTFSVLKNIELSEKEIRNHLVDLYPDMKERILNALLFLVYGNYKQVKNIIRTKKKFDDLIHGELIICIGRGFAWLHEPNKALIIGPYDNEMYSFEDAVAVAGGIILKNLKQQDPQKRKISKANGITVMCSSLFFEEGANRLRETIKAYTLYKIAKDVLEKIVPELSEYNINYIVGSTKQDDQLFRQINPSDYKKYLESSEFIKLSREEKQAIKSLK